MADSSIQEPTYKKLSGRVGGAFSRFQLWQSDDHLLLVSETGCVHEYRRFYFRDIQAVTVMSSPAYVLWGLVLPVIALFVLGGWFNAENKTFPTIVLAGLAVSWLVHMSRGKTCTCWIQTGINKQKLLMFRRLAAAERFVRNLRFNIETAQDGAFSLEEMERESTRPDPAMKSKPQPPPLPVVAEDGEL